jgi:hypothetical protein
MRDVVRYSRWDKRDLVVKAESQRSLQRSSVIKINGILQRLDRVKMRLAGPVDLSCKIVESGTKYDMHLVQRFHPTTTSQQCRCRARRRVLTSAASCFIDI